MAARAVTGNSAWGPLRLPVFRAFWIAAVAANTGIWLQNVGGVWLMTTLAPSAILVALMQAAANLPFLLFSLPAGALADIVDRRRLLIVTQACMVVTATALGVIAVLGMVNPVGLLLLTLVLGAASAANTPAWQATTPDVVPRPQLAPAVALGGISVSIAQVAGPTLGGLLIVGLGPAAVFFLNAILSAVAAVVFYRWHRTREHSPLPVERVLGAMRAGVRYVEHAPELQAVLIRMATFVAGGSALWALLPLVVRFNTHSGALGYGTLLAVTGLGAFAGAWLLPRLRQHASTDVIVVMSRSLWIIATLVAAFAHSFGALAVALFLGGVGWLCAVSIFNMAVETVVPVWVRARTIGLYFVVFLGGMGAGSVLWGAVAQRVGITVALVTAAITLGLGMLTALRFKIKWAEQLDMGSALIWPAPCVVVEPSLDAGPVMIIIEYDVEPGSASSFVTAMREVGRHRRRYGAVRWGLYRDAANPARFVETFLAESWAEHLRQHQHSTVEDRGIEERARQYQVGAEPIRESHLLYVKVLSPTT